MVARDPGSGPTADSTGPEHTNGRPANGTPALHQVGTLCQRQRLSVRTVASKWGVDASEIHRQQNESTDLTLSQLYRWQRMLGVPVTELLLDHDEPLSDTLRWRAHLIRAMKTVVLIQQTAREPRTQRLVATLIDQLTQIMPELAEVGPQQGSSARRGLNDLGRAVDYRLSEDTLWD